MSKIKTKNFLKIFVLSLALIFTAQSCNIFARKRPAAEKIQLVWWKPFDEQSQVNPLIEAFTAANPSVEIRYVRKNVETYEDELVDALASGTGPDIFSIHNDWLPKHKEKLNPAPEKIFPSREFRESFVEVASADLVTAGQIYGVPLAMDVLAMYYNKDLFASAGIALPPATWEELVDITPDLTRLDNQGNFQRSAIALGATDNVNRAPDILGLLMLQSGTQFYSDDNSRSTLSHQAFDETGKPYSPGARALDFYTQFANPERDTYTWNARSNNSIEAFGSGQVAMILSYSYLRTTLANKSPFLKFGVAGMPQIDKNKTRINFANYWAEGVSKQTKNSDTAWKFLKFITNRDVLPKYYEVNKQVSSRIDILSDQIKDPEIGVFAENALSAKSFYKPDSDAIENIFIQTIEDVILRSISTQEAISAAAEKINLLLESKSEK